TAEPAVTSDRQCAACVRDAGFSVAANAAACTAVTQCVAGEFVTVVATVSTDRACGACGAGGANFSTAANAAACTPTQQCVPGLFVVTDPT
ncbi:hypothetical protein, partial [Listeria monocytogenes]|uniref:hypothetical protein n=1 Tax=Listeria monocytogenes TaxID=1639 RepID=UPI002FDC63D2